MKNRLVSLTGATGFLGWHIAETMLAAGWRVRAMVRPGNRKPLPKGVESVEAPLEAAHAIAIANAFARADVVVHAAGIVRGSDARLREVNVGGTEAVVRAANAVSARLIFISSQAAAGPGTLAQPVRETDPPGPVNAYGRSKLAAEAVVQAEAKVPWVILRPTAVYGPRDRAFLPFFQLGARGIFPLPTPPEMRFTLLYVDDLVRAVTLAEATGRAVGQTMFVGHGQSSSAGELLASIADACGRRYRPVRVPEWMLRTGAAAGDQLWRIGVAPPIDSGRLAELTAPGFVCAVDRAREVLGFTASVALREGIESTAGWYRAKGWM